MKMKGFISITLCFILAFTLCQPVFPSGTTMTWTGPAGDGLLDTVNNHILTAKEQTTQGENVCEIDGTGYATLDEALIEVQSGKTIRLLTNIDYNKGIVIEDKRITFDLNGFNLNVVNPKAEGTPQETSGLYVLGDATVELEGEGEFNVTGKYGVFAASTDDPTDAITNNNTLVIVTNVTSIGDECTGVEAYNAKVEVRGNVISSGLYGYGVETFFQYAEVSVEGDVNVNGNESIGVIASSEAIVTVKGNITVNGNQAVGIEAYDDGEVIVEKDVTARGDYSTGIYAAGSYVNVNGDVTGDTRGLEATAYAMVNIYGDVRSLYFREFSYGIDVFDGCRIYVGGNVESKGAGVRIAQAFEAGGSDIIVDGVIEAPEYIIMGEYFFDFEDGIPWFDSEEPDIMGYRTYERKGSGVYVAMFAGGTGTAEDPYLVGHAHQLYNVRSQPNKCFKLTEDIDLSGYSSGAGWKPIGNNSTPFIGTFDGAGHTISGLFIKQVGEWNSRVPAGLFGYTGAIAEICNLALEDVEVTGCYYASGLVGYNNGKITNVSGSGNVVGEWDTGGLVGKNNGSITDSAFTGTVTGTDEIEYGEWTGGLVGYNLGTITNCQTDATVVSEGDNIGGLAGENLAGGIITESCSTGTVTGDDYIGGLVGSNCGEITACYSTCMVNGDSYVGGLVGGNSGPIANSFAAGIVTGNNPIGGLVGKSVDGTASGSYWDTDTSQQMDSDGGTGKTTAQMKEQASYEDWDFISIWDINGSDNNGYPFLRWQDYENGQTNAPPVLSETGASSITTATATLNFTSDKAGIYYYLVYGAENTAPNAATIKAQGEAAAKGTGTAAAAANAAQITGLTASTTYKAYVVVEDAKEYISNVVVISFTTLTPAPPTQPTPVTPPTPPTPAYEADVKAENGTETTLPVKVDKDAGVALVDMDSRGFAQGGTVITIPSIPDVDTYSAGIPVPDLSTTDVRGMLTLNTGAGSITVTSNMLTGVAGVDGNKAQITIGQGDKSRLPQDVKDAIGNRPLVQLTLSIDGRQTNWSNPNAPVTVSIPYTPTAAELANPESIVIWYIDSSGKAVSVPNGRYDAESGTVIFITTHFSQYAVAFNKVNFNDVTAGAWYRKAVSFIAARGITTGTGGGNYSPNEELTRGQFIVLLMRAYNIAPDTNPKDNFSDAGNTYYTGYLAAAKRLGISSGVGDNLYAPELEITRQEMFTLLYNTLKVIRQLPQGDSGKTLDSFSDAGQISSWAKEAMTLLVKTGTISGSGGKLSPTSTTTRAEMAQVLYNLLSK